MNGIHDLGGMHGFGTVEREVNEPLFHAAWERTVLAVQLTALRKRLYNLDELRHGIERMPAAEYLGATYYERWLAGISRLLVEKGILEEGELEARAAEVPEAVEAVPPTAPRPAGREEPVHPAFDPSRGHPFRREATAPARFTVGDAVLTKHFQPAGHTRLARYARGKRGVVDRHHGCFVFPDTNAHAEGEDPDHVYSVRFEGPELWGKTVEGRGAVYIDLWESYLESAG